MKPLFMALAILAVTPGAPVAAQEPTAATTDAEHDLGDLPLNRFGVGLFYQDVLALTPGTGGFIGPVGGSVMGVAATVQRRLSLDSPWFLEAGAGHGWGRERIEVLQPLAFTDRTSISALYARAGMGYEVRVTRTASGYASGGVFYSAAKARFDNGGAAIDGARFTAWGLDQALGARASVGAAASLYGELNASFGWGSGQGPDASYRATVKQGGFRGGILLGF